MTSISIYKFGHIYYTGAAVYFACSLAGILIGIENNINAMNSNNVIGIHFS